MSKFRIIKKIHDCGSKNPIIEWYIEEKKWLFGWKLIKNINGPKVTDVIHSSYEEAEKYLLKNYTGHGECIVNNNVYEYTPYTYYL